MTGSRGPWQILHVLLSYSAWITRGSQDGSQDELFVGPSPLKSCIPTHHGTCLWVSYGGRASVQSQQRPRIFTAASSMHDAWFHEPLRLEVRPGPMARRRDELAAFAMHSTATEFSDKVRAYWRDRRES
jgi:hypothetical protein